MQRTLMQRTPMQRALWALILTSARGFGKHMVHRTLARSKWIEPAQYTTRSTKYFELSITNSGIKTISRDLTLRIESV